MPSFAEQSKRNLKAIKEGGSRPFFIACDGRRTEIFVAKNGTVSQFKDVTKINIFIGKNKLGDMLTAKASIGAGTIQRVNGTCYFDLSIKKGVNPSLLQKHLGLTKRVFQITTFELGKPVAGDSSGGGEAAAAPTGGPDLGPIKAQLKTIKGRGKTISGIIDGGLGKDGSGVAGLADKNAVRAELKQLSNMRSNLKEDAEWLEGAIEELKSATDADSLKVRADLSKTLSKVTKLRGTVRSLGKKVLARKEELENAMSLDEVMRDLTGRIQRIDESARNIQNAITIRTGSDGANLGMELSQKETEAEVQAVNAYFQQQRGILAKMVTDLAKYKSRLQRALGSTPRTAAYDDLMQKLDNADMIAGNTINVVIDQTVAQQVNNRLAELRR